MVDVRQLEEAQQAEAELARLQGLAALAPQLRAQQAQEQRDEGARARLAQTETQARDVLHRAKPAMQEIAGRFKDLVDQAEQLARDYGNEVGKLNAAGQALAGSTLGAYAPGGHSAQDFINAWMGMGGGDPELQPFPQDQSGRVFGVPTLGQELARIITSEAGNSYHPGGGQQFVARR